MKTEFYKAIKSIDVHALSDDDKDELLKLFKITNDSLVRDHIAMIFSEVRYNKAIPYILKKVKDKQLYNNNGTLIAALRDLDASKYFTEFVKIVCTQDYEARLWALDLIEDFLSKVSKRTKKRALQTLSPYRSRNTFTEDIEYRNSIPHFVDEAIRLITQSLN